MKMDELPEIRGNTLKLVIPKAEKYHETITSIVYELVKKDGQRGIYVTLNRSSPRLAEVFAQKGIPKDSIFFVDAVSPLAGSCQNDESCCLCDPHNLSELSITVFKNLEMLPAEKRSFLIFDSLSSLLISNKASQIPKFLHSFTAEMRPWNLNGIIVSVEGEFEADVIRTCAGFFDEVIRVI
jgi:KaiC/GvpD/RAD55 family RecA-like ATPase